MQLRFASIGLVALVTLSLATVTADAGACGAEGQGGCGVFATDCQKNLVYDFGHKRCVHPPCGRDGEAACVVTQRIPSCDDNLMEYNGRCWVRNACGAEGQRPCTILERPAPWCNVNLKDVNGTCVHLPCGREKGRACTVAERGLSPACDQGLVEIPGCYGECKGSSSMCVAAHNVAITEPDAGWSPPPSPTTDPMRGWADIHVHMFSNLAFGGGVLAGAPYDPAGGIAKALGPDFGTDLDLESVAHTPVPVTSCPPLVPNCGRNVLHGMHTPDQDTMGLGTGDATGGHFGAPFFNAWPTWHSTTHQQVYYKWLERAWRGGMRLMTMLAVNNEFACGSSKHVRGAPCTSSMVGVDAQLAAAKAFETWHAAQPGGGWFKIVYSPQEAETAIRAGKLAVVLGIEVDTLFNCKLHNTYTTASVSADVDKYFAMGVRHIYPNHDFDGGFAGTALFMDALGAGNVFIEGAPFLSHPCPGVSDKGSLNCNNRGLTPLGRSLVTKLMDKGMMIDIDHMSALAIDETLTMAQARNYPLSVGHGLFSSLYADSRLRHERMRTDDQLRRLKALGSVVSVMTQDELEKDPDCKHSSVTFAKSLKYAHDMMTPLGIPFGSDFNGMAPHVGPRFGEDACGKDRAQAANQRTPLAYPFTIAGFGTFQKQVTGQRTFDFNTDGLAHIGLLPDLIGDLQAMGKDVEPLMTSAATYVNAWKRANNMPLLQQAPPLQKTNVNVNLR